MTPDEIDSQISDWKARIILARENLDALRKLPEYNRVICGPNARQSAATVGRVTEQLRELELSLDAIADVIDRAANLRGKFPKMMPSNSIAEIQALLEGPSIVVGAGQTPLDRRELLRPVEATHSITPRQLLQSMLESFRVVRDGVLEADRKIAAKLEQSTQETASAQRDLAIAKSEMEKLLQAHAHATRLDAERSLKVDLEDQRTTIPKVNGVAIDALGEQLQKLDESAVGAWSDELRIRLQLLCRAIDERLCVEAERIHVAESALNSRRDLRGLLDALMAKARDRGRANEPELSAMANQAAELLHRRPTPMKQAKAIVTAYQTRLL